MFLNKKYILANELVEKMGIHIANISMLMKEYEDTDNGTFVKMNNCTFINSNDATLPNNIKIGMQNNQFTDMTNKLPCTFVRSEYEITEKELFKSGMVTKKVEVAGKDFYEFAPEFVEKMKYKIGYVLDEAETMDCYRKKQILGYTQLSKNKYFTWY
jgi:putative SOS response-associated peptidase YedK